MNSLEKPLEDLGFTDKEAKVYLAMLELGQGSVIDIAGKAGLKRTTVYNLLPEMLQKGLIKVGARKRRRFFFIENLQNLKTETEERLETINSVLPELRAIHNIIPYKPKIIFYEGVGGMKELYQDTLDSLSGGDTILSYTGLEDFFQFMPREYMDWYVAERVRRKIRIRIIVPDSEATKEILPVAEKTLREIKVVKDPKFRYSADTEIYSNKVALISYRENFMGVIVESKEINQMQRMAFELMWNSLTSPGPSSQPSRKATAGTARGGE